MLRPPPRLFALLGLAACLGASAAGAAEPAGKAVVELFTSQGCSSCPPADKLLGEFAARGDIIALTLAVDYWDYLGWKDTLAKHGHSLRQKAYARARGDGKMFTPQIVVNGTAMAVGSDFDAVTQAIAAAAAARTVPVSLDVHDGRLRATVGHGTAPSIGGEVWLCPVATSQTVAIGRGENQGATMTYHNVVRRWVKLGTWSGGEATFDIPLDEVRGGGADAMAVLVQAGSQAEPGAILGADLIVLP
ncbi:MAG TPA: DUF1223 domain-containing protein [Xanthobacteraceae bacterium]|nr:DUF1223 domain-containing protein [Xanthobacteraceae bacterium]